MHKLSPKKVHCSPNMSACSISLRALPVRVLLTLRCSERTGNVNNLAEESSNGRDLLSAPEVCAWAAEHYYIILRPVGLGTWPVLFGVSCQPVLSVWCLPELSGNARRLVCSPRASASL